MIHVEEWEAQPPILLYANFFIQAPWNKRPRKMTPLNDSSIAIAVHTPGNP